MALLRTLLYAHAGVWALVGVGLAVIPKAILNGLFDQPNPPEYAWIRLVGILLIGLALFMVLVAHRVEELWWWSWGFVLSTGAVAALFTLNAAFGVDEGASSVLWWVGALVSWGLASGTLLGLSRAGREKPPDRFEPAPARTPRPAR